MSWEPIGRHGEERTKQAALLRLALEEAGPCYDFAPLWEAEPAEIDHLAGRCRFGTDEWPVVYPRSWVEKMAAWAREPDSARSVDYFYAGVWRETRTWLLPPRSDSYQIHFTSRGREVAKDCYDDDYYGRLQRSRFGLCPETEWTYRFIECLFCGALPVVERVSAHMVGAEVLLIDDPVHQWTRERALRNLDLALGLHTIHIP